MRKPSPFARTGFRCSRSVMSMHYLNVRGFYAETAGQRRDDRIFDETAVVGVQEFASRLQSGLVPNFARWADLMAGSEVPPKSA